ncbi:TetR/AcrR family transcriptional regulator [Aetokthonos hydrillicola Thurmond2011]|jgi:AcrR family transcriptional regulator|uniref:TetR/AcrR family transcriptional regulator n=1 Tax=Aetokthonos hydrillicola Thurmond2011 TaxID=2712845 RepID=A0AAP5IC30_9CYAN|nr:TetR/AcrR family transcriptional regulator [Aetokthonos hydrillicola]MBO3464276.1 TetR/AcrR family transcriptional regulator [Aetokthonos hydrillicola CCALA 1050]MBW4587023.1 TetR/AcrR family transcriptional regulator [Aetokthonos hydrillicola CCALA 1050]MDR9897504.1 TetR/AcrR family transcriptional regulator [Aetokthonos hydrillicola Thurmond2011]
MSDKQSSVSTIRRKPHQARSQERVNRILDVAEALFVAQGYAATTTNEIAKQAQVPIGSLYQFFSDKKAIVQALVVRYNQLYHERLALLDNRELAQLPLSTYVEQLIDTTTQFFNDYPGYYAIFMEVQGAVSEAQEAEDTADAKLITDLATALAQRDAGKDTVDYEIVAFVLVKAISPLVWLSLGQEPVFQQQLTVEAKRLALSYLQSYLPSS